MANNKGRMWHVNAEDAASRKQYVSLTDTVSHSYFALHYRNQSSTSPLKLNLCCKYCKAELLAKFRVLEKWDLGDFHGILLILKDTFKKSLNKTNLATFVFAAKKSLIKAEKCTNLPVPFYKNADISSFLPY